MWMMLIQISLALSLYFFGGIVSEGNNTWEERSCYPTANMVIWKDPRKLVPGNGVLWFVDIEGMTTPGEKFHGMDEMHRQSRANS
jgi:hypothetical protein